MAASSENCMVVTHPTRYDPAVSSTEGKFTVVSIVPHHITRGFIHRAEGKRTLVGYCVEDPLEVLKQSLPDYIVSSINGYRFFDSNDMQHPKDLNLALSLRSVDPVFGIEGKIKELLELEQVLKAKRDYPFSAEDAEMMIRHLEGYKGNPVSRDYKQKIQDISNICMVIRAAQPKS